MAQPIRKQRWLQRLLAIIGTGLEQAGRTLRGKSGEPVSTTVSADPDGLPAHWLELLSKSEVPLVWVRQKTEDTINPYPREGWQTGVHIQGELPADSKETASSEIPAAMDHVNSHESTLSTVLRETSPPKPGKKIEWFQETPETHKTLQLEWSGQEDKTQKPRIGLSIIPRPSIPSNLQSGPYYTSRNPFHLRLTSKFSQLDHSQRAKQTVSSMPRYVHIQSRPQAELYWPEESSGASAIAPRYETSQRSAAGEVSFSELSSEPKANKDLFPDKPLSVDRWPSLPPDWLATEPESSITPLEQFHRQRLEQEWRGEQ
jgi:hypothetical protein